MHASLSNYTPGNSGITASELPRLPGTRSSGALFVDLPFPARLRVSEPRGESTQLRCVLDRLSATALHVRLPRALTEGERVPMVVRLSTDPERVPTGVIGIGGTVTGIEIQPDGTYLTRVALTRHWFFFSAPA